MTALLAVRWLLSFVQAHTFQAFGVYRLFFAAVVATLLFWPW